MILYRGKLHLRKATQLMLVYHNDDFRGVYIPKSIFSEHGLTVEPQTISIRIGTKIKARETDNRNNKAAEKHLKARKGDEAKTKGKA